MLKLVHNESVIFMYWIITHNLEYQATEMSIQQKILWVVGDLQSFWQFANILGISS